MGSHHCSMLYQPWQFNWGCRIHFQKGSLSDWQVGAGYQLRAHPVSLAWALLPLSIGFFSWLLGLPNSVSVGFQEAREEVAKLPMTSFQKFFFFNFYLFIYLFIYLIYLWLCWVFVSVQGLSPVVASRVHSSSRCAGPSLSRALLLQSTGSRRAGSVVVAHGPSRSTACGIFPDQRSNPCPLHWQADSQPLCHQGSPRSSRMSH